MRMLLEKFWTWYEQHYLFNLTATTFLFVLQAFHLYWLFTDVILKRLVGQSYFIFPGFWGILSTFLDYTEIPALISTSLLYIHEFRQNHNRRSLLYLFLLNIQWLHLFWITDEIVIEKFQATSFFHWSVGLAWIAILIDYAELPVMADTLMKTIKGFREYFRKLS